jgi:P-type Ca2+ transporter type 2C
MLGSATVLCVDKTGTLTLNRMAVRELSAAPGKTHEEILQAAMFASSEDPVDPMEKALHDAASVSAASPHVFVREYPLSGELLAMSRVIERRNDGFYDVFAKGAPEAIAQLCRLSENGTAQAARGMAERGLRVLGVARTRIPKEKLPESQRHFDFEFMGLVGLEDPVRNFRPRGNSGMPHGRYPRCDDYRRLSCNGPQHRTPDRIERVRCLRPRAARTETGHR